MASIAVQRIKRELKEVLNSDEVKHVFCGLNIITVNGFLFTGSEVFDTRWAGRGQFFWVERRNCRSSGHTLRRRPFPAWNQDPRNLSFQPTKSPLHHTHLASECFVCYRRHMPWYFKSTSSELFEIISNQPKLFSYTSSTSGQLQWRCGLYCSLFRLCWPLQSLTILRMLLLRGSVRKNRKFSTLLPSTGPTLMLEVLKHSLSLFNFTLWKPKLWTGPKSNSDYDQKIKKLKELGVSEASARDSLSSCDWDLDRATEQIFSWGIVLFEFVLQKSSMMHHYSYYPHPRLQVWMAVVFWSDEKITIFCLVFP